MHVNGQKQQEVGKDGCGTLTGSCGSRGGGMGVLYKINAKRKEKTTKQTKVASEKGKRASTSPCKTLFSGEQKQTYKTNEKRYKIEIETQNDMCNSTKKTSTV